MNHELAPLGEHHDGCRVVPLADGPVGGDQRKAAHIAKPGDAVGLACCLLCGGTLPGVLHMARQPIAWDTLGRCLVQCPLTTMGTCLPSQARLRKLRFGRPD